MAGGVALAQPKKDAPPAPAKEPEPAATPAAGDGSAVTPIEDAAPADMEGTSENPDAPRGTEETSITAGPIAPTAPVGYPIEEALRPIVLPETMAEVSISPHFQATRNGASDALRARYGITNKVQLGITYVYGGFYDEPATAMKKYAFHVGKAAGLDVTMLLQNWVAVRVGIPVYFDPFAMGVQIDAPMKFRLSNKLAIGVLDDFINIALPVGAEFAPDFYQESRNAAAANRDMTGSTQSRGRIRISGYADYQLQPNLALIGRLAFDVDDFSGNRNNAGCGGIETRIHGGVQFTPAKWIDVGGQLGWDDLSKLESFGLQGFLALRI
ncbi:MAG: hypothetical protein HOV81_41825 [Kofleriaceae bacterium]|nr:hypothetical protein [Kofleriaceae bacterium]